MTNIVKYLLLLEKLRFPEKDYKTTVEAISENVEILEKLIKYSPEEVLQKIVNTLELEDVDVSQAVDVIDAEGKYALYLQHILLEIAQQVNFDSAAKSDLISMRHVNLCIEALQDLGERVLWQNLHPAFCQKGVFAGKRASVKPNYALLQVSVAFFARMLQIKQLHMANSMEYVVRDYMAAIYTLFLAHFNQELSAPEVKLKRWHKNLNSLWPEMSKQYFRNTMLLKGIPTLPAQLQKLLHQQLVQKLAAREGFASFIATMQTAQQNRRAAGQQETRDEHMCELVANIVAHRAHTQKFQYIMITQIFQFIDNCLLHNSSLALMEGLRAAILTLRRFYDLSELNKQQIIGILRARMREFYDPEDLLSGLLLMEHQQFCLLVSHFFQLFCTSSVECLPSTLLTDYLPLLLQLHFNVPAFFPVRQQLASLIARCLANATELELVIEQLYTQQYPASWLQLHPRIIIALNEQQTALSLKIAPPRTEQECSISLALPEVLMAQQHNMLTFRVFMTLLRQLAALLEQTADTPAANIELLQSEEELLNFLHTHYPVKVEILYTLNLLVSHQPLRAQFSEHTVEFLKFLREFTARRLTLQHNTNVEEMDQVLLMLLLVAEELLQRSQLLPETFGNFATQLEQLHKVSANQLIRQRIDRLLPILRGEFNFAQAESRNAFDAARALIETRESHLQVYGIQMLLDLLRRKDAASSLNRHVIIALALSTLKDRESYTFLNCVRLFVALVNIMEAEVLEMLCHEYMNEQAAIDYRLVVGETVLKVSKEIGKLRNLLLES